MLNTERVMLLAGNPEPWDEEIRKKSRRGSASNTFNSEDLCELQIKQSSRGRLSAHLVLSMYGWTVRYASGLQGFSILYSSRNKDPKQAYDWGVRWTNEDPDKREFFVSRSEVARAIENGIDCSCLKEK